MSLPQTDFLAKSVRQINEMFQDSSKFGDTMVEIKNNKSSSVFR